MHEPEARWLANHLRQLPTSDLSPMLNVGSSTKHFREVKQPWIEREIFAPLARAGCRVVHLDMKIDEGVDLCGDLMDPQFFGRLRSLGAGAVFCSNVLEHVSDPSALARQLEELVPVGGYLVVSVPHRFPYHPDPIDTLFRPDLETLRALFPRTRLIAGEVVDCGTIWDTMGRSWAQLAARIAWLPLFFVRRHGWIGNVHKLRALRSRASATCAVLQRV
jgi:methyltransferase family protein